ncbi:unnamed protein product [Adineta steineri]|uniref:NHL repeat containing protein n=1 Tax=Adineta steineri TaxID=433720 RepID=A0A814G189_9BILA|nr:unnamed protein product [Adineta steineri]CAF0994683.1 unnamed protein product [Adineta steineri]
MSHYRRFSNLQFAQRCIFITGIFWDLYSTYSLIYVDASLGIFSLYVLFFIALLSPTSRIVTISNLTPSLFDQLHREHGETLSCPCSTITIPYSTFVTNMVSFHPFELLAALCSISNDTVSKALLDIQNNQLVTVELLEEEDIQSQVEAMVKLVQTTAYVQVTSFLQLVQMMYRSNTLVSAFGTNAVVQIGSGRVLIYSTNYVRPYITEINPSYALSCAETNMKTPAVFYAQPLDTSINDHIDWPTYHGAYSSSIISASIDGFFGGCFALDSILNSTLDCLHNFQCLETLFDYFPALNQSKFKLIDLPLSSGRRNISVNDLVSDLFIEQNSTKINYTNYFNQCAPLVCTYSTIDSINLSSILSLLISLYGGLTAILRLIAPLLITIIWKIRHRPIKITINYGSILCLLLFNSLKSQTITIIEKNPSLTKYKQLQILYPDTLTCPCANTTMPYKTFVSLSPIFHQICSSDLISESWISLLSNSGPNDVLGGSWISKAAQYFGLLSSICQLANSTATNNTHVFFARTFVTSYVLIETDFNIQVNATVKQLTESIVISFNLFNIMTRLFIQADQPIIVSPEYNSQVKLDYINTTAGTKNPQALHFTFVFNTITKNNSVSSGPICQCVVDPNCQGPITFAIEGTAGILRLPGYHPPYIPSAYVAPGLVDACYTIDFLLLSTLQCFYTDSNCMNKLIYYTNNKTYPSPANDSNLYAHALIYNQTTTRFPPNTSVSSIVEEMMIEQWNASLSFPDYYKACAPTYCTYTQIKHAETFSELLVTLISTVGGLVMVLRLITFQLVKIIFGLFQKKPKKQQQVRRKLLDRFKALLSKLITFLSAKMLNLNIFPARIFGSNIDRIMVKYLGQWSTRLYLILLSIIFIILTLYTAIQPQTLTKSFSTPSLNFYKNLMNDHSDELECPCSLISSPYDDYVQIQPIFHQICSSDLISNEWRLNITANLISNLSVYNHRDYRLFLSTHLQFLNGLCQLSMQTVNQSIQQSLSSLMITKQLLSEENFNLHINSMINEAKSNAPSTFIRLFSLLQATNHGNAIVSAYGTNYQYLAADDSTFQSILYTQAMIYDDNCSCQLNSTCIINASFIEINSTQPITIKGLKMGCTPSESLLASTLECFYDQSCINLIQTMAGYNKNITPIPLNITNSRFLMNMTVMNLINDLFVEKWSAIMNYSSYFYKCSPMICSYTYIQQLDSFYTLTYLLGLYGGLTIVLKWISPKIVYFISKIYQRRKKTTNSIKPISTVESETIEIMDANNINNTTASSQSLQTVPTHSKKLFSVSSNYWIFGLIVFIIVTIGILIPFIYVFQEKKNHSASTVQLEYIEIDYASCNKCYIFSESISITKKKIATTVSSKPTLGKLPKPNYQNMQYKKLLIGKNEEDAEMASKRTDAFDVSPERKSESENINNIKQSTRPRTGFLIAIISTTIWIIFIEKAETTINTTTTTRDASTAETTILTASTTTAAMLTTWTTETSIHTTSAAKTTMLTTSTNSHTTTMSKPKWDKWKQNAITVAGGNGEGQELNQLNRSHGIFIDKKKNIFIADSHNHRIVEWKYNANEGQIIAGGNGNGSRMDQLSFPIDVIVDEQNHSIIIADYGNRRVILWFNQNQQILIKNITCYGLAMDKHGFLYVSDYHKNEVRRWKMGEYNNEGIVVAGGNEQGSRLNQLHTPTFIFVDEDQSIYVPDVNNNRVVKWRKDAKEGTVVAGRSSQGKSLSQLCLPKGVIVDDLGQIYVADLCNDRIMRWCEGKEEGEIVVGGNGQGNKSNQLHYPYGLSFDDEGNLYVADFLNHRIQKFEIIL